MEEPEGTFKFRAGVATHQTPGATFDPETRSLKIPMPADPEDQARRIAWNLWNTGKTPAAIDAGEFVIEADKDPLPAYLGRREQEFVLEVGVADDSRLFTKMALELLAYHLPLEARRSSLFKARRFARFGEWKIAFKGDVRSPGSGHAPGLANVAHSIEVWTCAKHVLARVVFFGNVKLTASLADNWDGTAFALMYAFDPRSPPDRFDGVSAADGPPFAVWHKGLLEEAKNEFVEKFNRLSRAIGDAAPTDFERAPPPDLVKLRPLIEAEYVKILEKKGAPKVRKPKPKPPCDT